MDKLVERLVEMDAKATPARALEVSRYSHVGARVCQGDNLIADFYDEDNRECFLAARNALPALVEYVKASDDLAAEYAHYLNERDGVQRELDPYDAARAALLSALGGDR